MDVDDEDIDIPARLTEILQQSRGEATITPDLMAEVLNSIDWLDRGLSEWRKLAIDNELNYHKVQAALRIAIRHLAVALDAGSSEDAIEHARDWLLSVRGSDE